MVYFPGTEILITKGLIALKAALAAKGAAATAIAHQAGTHALSTAVSSTLYTPLGASASYAATHTVGASLAHALAQGATAGAGALMAGGTIYTVAEVVGYMINEMREDGYSDAEIRKYFLDTYDIVFE
ncbi:hypothetical protein J7I98_17565 [Streptomyces sp. ISL-98]|uniref:hypothetical protein n=1 Tax=Streptomyces sp. ISL-98 TaxID=2819192 RepID=UPI001BEC34A9|nr:hypothetical protein [Streptomyces sp. ISL-98]MBT2507662.1 hypothetical protein [Streptomyces sp. ISL-98]